METRLWPNDFPNHDEYVKYCKQVALYILNNIQNDNTTEREPRKTDDDDVQLDTEWW